MPRTSPGRTATARLTATALLCLTAAARAQFTQFTITSTCTNNVQYTLSTVPASTTSVTGSGVLRAAGTSGSDHLYQDWWWYRVGADTREYAFNTASSANFIQLPATPRNNRRVLLWTDCDGRGFGASLVYEVVSTGPTSGMVTQTMRVSNLGSTPLTISLYHYADLDVGGSTSNTAALAAAGPPRQVAIYSGTVRCHHLACGFDNYETSGFSTLRSKLTDTSRTDLGNTGLPFTGDWTGAFQWRDRVVPPNGTLTVTATIAVDFLVWTCGTAAVTNYCSPKAGTHGFPSFENEHALLGGRLELGVVNGRPGAVPILLLGAGQICVPVAPFGTLAVNQILSIPMAPFDAAKTSRCCLAIPDNPSMLGFAFHNQVWFADPGAAGYPVAHTDGLELQLGSH